MMQRKSKFKLIISEIINQTSGKTIMSIETQRILAEMTKNYNKMLNNMLAECGKLCFDYYDSGDLKISESNCVENCHNKYFATYFIGEKFSRHVTDLINEDKVPKDINFQNFIEDTKSKINL